MGGGYDPASNDPWSITGGNDYQSDGWGTQTAFPLSTVYRIVRDYNTAVCRNLPVSVAPYIHTCEGECKIQALNNPIA